METTDIIQEVKKLNLNEKILLVENIWDIIAVSNKNLSLPEWQKKELDKRYSDYKKGILTTHDWQSVHEELRSKYK